MIEISFWDFHEQKYEEKDYCLYVMKNGLGDVLYIGISVVGVWGRWFGWGGHMIWDGNIILGESVIGKKNNTTFPILCNGTFNYGLFKIASNFLESPFRLMSNTPFRILSR